jgi:AraC-like DNA-binding protein
MVRHFLPCLPEEVKGDWMPAEDLWGPGLWNLLHRLAELESFPEQVRILCQWLREQRAREEKPDGAVDFALESIYAEPLTARMETLPGLIGLGHRQFQRRFRAAVGLNAKRFHRLVRLYRLVRQELLNLNPQGSYLNSALDLGFYDQAHVIHDFQDLTGRSPANFLREARSRTHFYNSPRGPRT